MGHKEKERKYYDMAAGKSMTKLPDFRWKPMEMKLPDYALNPTAFLLDPPKTHIDSDIARLKADLISRLSDPALKYAMDYGHDIVLEARPRKPKTQLPPPDPTSITAAEANDFLATLPEPKP